jgi:hypothetical protein
MQSMRQRNIVRENSEWKVAADRIQLGAAERTIQLGDAQRGNQVQPESPQSSLRKLCKVAEEEEIEDAADEYEFQGDG